MSQLGKDEILGYIQKLKQLENDLSSGETEDLSFLNDLNDILGRLSTEFKENEFKSTSDLIIRVKRLHPNAVIPSYSKDGDAGMDLTITDIKEETKSSITYGYGIVIEIPVGYVGLIIFDNIVIIKNNVALEVKSNNKTYKVGDTYGKLLILPEIKFNLKE